MRLGWLHSVSLFLKKEKELLEVEISRSYQEKDFLINVASGLKYKNFMKLGT
jgi:hypothetical protein